MSVTEKVTERCSLEKYILASGHMFKEGRRYKCSIRNSEKNSAPLSFDQNDFEKFVARTGVGGMAEPKK